jgi:uncharacterized membrane protein
MIRNKEIFRIYPAFDRLREQAVLKSQWLWLGLIFTAGAALRFYRIDAMSLWEDEAIQYQIASAGSLSEVILNAMAYANPPLSQIINYFFLQAGSSDFFHRLPSVLFGVASFPVFYLVAVKITPQRAALIATAIFVFSPFHLWYSQEARPYVQLMFFSLFSTLFLFAALERGGLARWTTYMLAMICGFATQVFMGFVLTAHIAWVITCHRNRLKPYLAAAAGILLPFAWLLPFFVRSFMAACSINERWGFEAGWLAYTVFTYSVGFSFGPNMSDLLLDRSLSGLVRFAPGILSVALIFGTLFILGIKAFKKKKWQQTRTLCLYGICFTLGGTALYAMFIAYNVRYTAVAFPFFCVLVGAGLNSLWRNKKYFGAAFAIGMACITGLSVYNYFENARYFKPDVRSAVAYWKQDSIKEPLISNSGLIVNRYIDRTDNERFYPISPRLDFLTEISNYFSSKENHLIYVLISRTTDWNRSIENEVHKRWKVVAENRFAGTVLISIAAN